MDPYQELGVEKNADLPTIKRQYRKRAQKAHPDKGGKREDFHRLHSAYALLTDPHRRARYDATGETGAPDADSLVWGNIARLLQQVLEQADTRRENVVQLMISIVERDREQHRTGILTAESKKRRLQKTIERFSRKGGGANMLRQILEAQVADIDRQIAGSEDARRVGDRIIAELKEYEYATDPAPTEGTLTFAWTSSTAA